MKDLFLGREKELEILNQKYNEEGFKMVVIYGRRRIGKTTLINHFIDNQKCKAISFTAVEREEPELLSMMTDSVLAALAPEMLGTIQFSSFEMLFDYVGKVAKEERIIFLIDEYPYLAKQCSKIQSILQKYIDKAWKDSKLMFIICGSLVGFMKDEVLGEAAPLHGRSDLELKLRPFNYKETGLFLSRYSLEDKAIVYGLTNGVAKYIRQFDDSLSLDENIIRQFYSLGGYFSEEQVKTVITGDRKNPAQYNTIISAIASGHTKNSEIASCLGNSDITYPLKMLVNAELIEKRMAGKPYYVLNDTMLEFWFKYVNRAISLINAGRGEVYYNSIVKDSLHDYMGKVFEKMAKEYILEHAGDGEIPLITEIADYQKTVLIEDKKSKQIELDIAGWLGKDLKILGECKFKKTAFGKEDLENFLGKVRLIPGHDVKLYLFSLGGYTDYVKNNANGIRLIEIGDMY